MKTMLAALAQAVGLTGASGLAQADDGRFSVRLDQRVERIGERLGMDVTDREQMCALLIE